MEYNDRVIFKIAEAITDFYKKLSDLGVPVAELPMNKHLIADGLSKMKRAKPFNNMLDIEIKVDFIRGQD